MGVQLPKSKKTVDFGGRGGIAPIRKAPVEIAGIPGKALSSAANALNKAAQTGISIWQVEQTERDNNFINSNVNKYQEQLIPDMEGFRNQKGSDTEGNVEEYRKTAEKRREELKKISPRRVHTRIDKQFNLIDYHNERELARIRSQGQADERTSNHIRAQQNDELEVTENADKLESKIARRWNMYDEEVENNTMPEEVAAEEKRRVANELTVKAIEGVIDNEIPEVAQFILDENKDKFRKYLDSDQIIKFEKSIKTIKKSIEVEGRRRETEAETQLKKATKDKQDATNKEYALRTIGPVGEGGPSGPDTTNPLTHPEIAKALELDSITPEQATKWSNVINKQAKGTDLTKESNASVEKQRLIEAEALSPDSTPQEVQVLRDKLNDDFALGKDNGGLSFGAVNRIQSEIDKNIKDFMPEGLKDTMKIIDNLADDFSFAPGAKGTEFQKEIANNDAVNNVKRDIKTCFNKTQDIKSCRDSALTPIFEARAKEVMTGFLAEAKGFVGFEKEREAQKILKEAEERKRIEQQQINFFGVSSDFDPNGTGFDDATFDAIKGKAKDGHKFSRVPQTGLILKGTGHPTFSKTIDAEKKRGNKILEINGRFFSFSVNNEGAKQFLNANRLPLSNKNIKLAIDRLKETKGLF